MVYAATMQRNGVVDTHRGIHWQSKRIGLLPHDEESGAEFWNALEDLRENVLDRDGQYISLDVANPLAETLPEMFYAALKNACWERSLSFSLPVILQHNPRVASPFLNQAILWQRLCDLIIVDDEPRRKTVMVLENIDQASPAVQHEIARLVRFHTTHGIHRTFVFTLEQFADSPGIVDSSSYSTGSHSIGAIIPELRIILGI